MTSEPIHDAESVPKLYGNPGMLGFFTHAQAVSTRLSFFESLGTRLNQLYILQVPQKPLLPSMPFSVETPPEIVVLPSETPQLRFVCKTTNWYVETYCKVH